MKNLYRIHIKIRQNSPRLFGASLAALQWASRDVGLNARDAKAE